MEICREDGFVRNININIAVVKWKSSFENSLNNESKKKHEKHKICQLVTPFLMTFKVINFDGFNCYKFF